MTALAWGVHRVGERRGVDGLKVEVFEGWEVSECMSLDIKPLASTLERVSRILIWHGCCSGFGV